MTRLCLPTMRPSCALLLYASLHGARSRAAPIRCELAYGHHSLQLFQQRQPAIERCPPGANAGSKKTSSAPILAQPLTSSLICSSEPEKMALYFPVAQFLGFASGPSAKCIGSGLT